MKKTLGICLTIVALAAGAAWGVDGTLIPIDGVGGSGIDGFRLTPDGQTIVFVGSLDGNGDEAYSVPVTGGAPVLLSDLNDGIGDIDDPPITDGVYGYFLGDLDSGNTDNAWFRRPLDGSGTIQQITPIDAEADARVIDGGARFIYLNDGEANSPTADELFVVPNDGSLTATRFTPDDLDIDQAQWEITNDGQTLIYGAAASGQPVEFFSLPLSGGGTPSPITPAGLADFAAIVDMDLTPDDSTIVFTADQEVDGGNGLYSMSVAGGALTPIVQTFEGALDVGVFQVSPDGTKVAFVGDIESNQVFNLYVVDIDGSNLTNLTPNVGGDFDVANGFGDLAWSPDSGTLYFVADQIVNGTNELFSIPVPEPSSWVLLVASALGLGVLRRR